jgi:predicted dehydrogenase
MKQYGFGIIGAGGMIGRFHARAIEELPNAKLVALCDMSEKALKSASEKFGVEKTFTDYKALLALPEVDVVTICTPSGAHAEPAIAAAEAGKHVICEKPLDITLERIDRMIDAHEEAGTKLGGVFQSRFADNAAIIGEVIEKGRFGKLTFGGAYVPWWRDQKYYDKGGWKGTSVLDGGGALMNQSIHAIDLLLSFMGPVQKVCGFTSCIAHENIDVEDTAVASLIFENGAMGVIVGATSMWPGRFKRLEISGTKGTVINEEDDITLWRFADETEADEKVRQKFAAKTSTGGGASDPSAISFEGHKRNFAAFLKALDEGRDPELSGREARKAVELISAIYRSARTGKPIQLPL